MDRLVVDAISVKRSQGDLSVRSDHQSDEDPEAVPVEFGNMVYEEVLRLNLTVVMKSWVVEDDY